MSTGDEFRRAASELKAEAANEGDREIAVSLDSLAECFLRLAEQSDKKALADVWAQLGRESRR